MKPIHFRGQNYDPKMLVIIHGQGRRQVVPTADIISIASSRSIAERIAVQVDKKFHLLTGAVDMAAQSNEIYILSTVQLKKALVQPVPYEERRAEQRNHNAERQFMGNSGWNAPRSNSGTRSR